MKKFIPILTVLAVMIILACLIIPVYAAPGVNAGYPGGKTGGGMTNSSLNHLAERGYDVTAIQAAVESGDMDTARSLMQQFMEEHRDEFPAPPEREDRITGQLDHLAERGYDVTAIQAAVESGDMDTARSLMQQFMEEHRDEFPAPPGMDKPGRGIAGICGNKTA